MQASEVTNRAASQVLDESGRTWSEDELLSHLEAAQRAVVKLNPKAYTKTGIVKLRPGVVQDSPGQILHRVTRNMGTDGSTPGDAVRRVDESVLTRIDPGWANDKRASDRVRHWMRDDQEPHVFYVEPPSTGNGYVEVTYAAEPGSLTDPNDSIALDDDWAPALVSYVVSEALAKESGAQSWNASQMHYERFLQQVSGSAEAKVRWDPKGSRKRQQGIPDG